LTRRLTLTDYGVFKQVFLIVNSAITILPLGFGMSAYYYLPRERDDERRGQVIMNIVLLSLIMSAAACVVLFLSPQLLANIFHDSSLARYSPLVGLVILLWLFSSFLETVTVSNEELKLATVFIVGAQLSKTTLMLAAAAVFGTVDALVYSALIQGGIQTAVLLWYLASRFPHFWK